MSIGSNLVPANNAAHWAAFVCLKSVEWVIRVGATISRAADRLDVQGCDWRGGRSITRFSC